MAQVHLRGVKKTYDNKVEVIHGIDMEIADGEFIVIVGPSGCGKSTLLRMVAGLERITGGEVAIGDRVVNELEPKDRDIAMVFQNYALYPHMSVYENIAYGLKIKKMAKDEIDRRVQKAAKTLELSTFLFRQFFLSVPDELTEAARVDGASPMRFFWDILLPMSRTSIAALFVIQFIYGWNQYLWPLLITTKESFYTVVMGVSRQANVVDAVPSWNLLMAMAMLAALPPVLVVVFMQRQFVRGLVETEK